MKTKTLATALLACLLLATVAAITPAHAEEPLGIDAPATQEMSHSYRSYLMVIKDKGDYHLNTVYVGLVVNNLPPVPLNDNSLPSLAPEGDGDQTIPLASLETVPLAPSGYAPLRLTVADIPKKADVVAVQVRDPILGTTQTMNFGDENVQVVDDRGKNITVAISGLWVAPDHSYEVALISESEAFLESAIQLLTTNEQASNALRSAGEPQPMSGGTANPPSPGGGGSGQCSPRTVWGWNRWLSTGSNYDNTQYNYYQKLLNRANGITYYYSDGCYSNTQTAGDLDFGYGIKGRGIQTGVGDYTIWSALDYNGDRDITWKQSGGNWQSKGHDITLTGVTLVMNLPTNLGATYEATTNPEMASYSCERTLPYWFEAALVVVDETGIISDTVPTEVCGENYANHHAQKHRTDPAGGYISLKASNGPERHLGAWMIYYFTQYGDWVMDMETNAHVYADMRGCYDSCAWRSDVHDYWTWQSRDNKIVP